MTTVLARTLDGLCDALWKMRPRSRCIYEMNGMIAQMYHGLWQWYKWSENDGGYIWSGSTQTRGMRYTTKWTRI